METKITLDRTMIAVGTSSTVHLVVELAAPAARTRDRAPIDVVVVLDRSGSMSGAPMHSVREATCNLLRLLGPNDRIGVVAFDDGIDTVLPLARHDVGTASAAVRAVREGGSTNLSGGWSRGFDMLSTDVRPAALRRIVVLTDGHANAGITDRDALCSLVAGAKRQAVSTTTIGFDDGYDEVLLAAIADSGAGNAYWCAGPAQAAEVFAAEFEGLSSVVAQDISVEMRPRPGIDLTVLNDLPVTAVTSGVQVVLGDAYGRERRHVVAALCIPSRPAAGSTGLVEVVVRWEMTVGAIARHEVVIPVEVGITDGPGADVAPDPGVTELVMVLRAARAQQQAHEDLLRGDSAAARRSLSETIDLLAPLPAQAAAAAQARFDLEELEAGGWTASSSKRLHSAMRSKQIGRRTGYDDNPG